MKLVNQSIGIRLPLSPAQVFSVIEEAGRTAYQSEPGDAEVFVRARIKQKHWGILEHISLSAKIVCSRAIGNELTRHRLASFVQESTRYCNYSKGKFNTELTFIKPGWWDEPNTESHKLEFTTAAADASNHYFRLLATGMKPEYARDVLPLSLKTSIFATMNLRQWLYVIDLRTEPAAHPDMRALMESAKTQLRNYLPVLFEG